MKNVSEVRISIKQYNQEINESIAQIKDGNVFTHEEVGKHLQELIKKHNR